MSRRDPNTTKVFVGSLPPSVTTDDLRTLFDPYGKIVECDIANRCGFLHLEDRELAFKAIEELNNTNFMGGRISVEKGRVKQPRRNRDGGPMRGGRDRGGPYSRDDGGYGRGPPRNGMGGYGGGGGGGGGRDYGYGERYGDFDRNLPLRNYGSEYENMGDRRPMYDDRRGYMDDRRGYEPPNGYGYPENRGGYDERRLPPPSGSSMPNSYEDRRPLLNERRPLLDQGISRGPAGGFDRGSTNDMFSRRAEANKPSIAPTPGYGERDTSVNYGTNNTYGATNEDYNNSSSGVGTYNTNAGTNNYAGSGTYAAGGYGDTRGTGSGYGNNMANQAPYGGSTAPPYNAANTGTGYGDNYNSRVGGAYDTVYPLPQQRSFGGSAGGPGPRRDMPGRRY